MPAALVVRSHRGFYHRLFATPLYCGKIPPIRRIAIAHQGVYYGELGSGRP
ncbi:MAG: hypothetical protein RID53_26140 [Coleofasciculus sp. B1-GNL1-01]|uniref:hypothetical protein n=1 Tax=Coleofasciculus sp. B1-GNL1-01 TaxID=3068484 RepID=UPI0032F3F959